MGSLYQELGHDIVLRHFIHMVLGQRRTEPFYLVSPATGPRLDIYLWNEEKKEYISVFGSTRAKYIPRFVLRFTLEEHHVGLVSAEYDYRKEGWYVQLSNIVKRDLVSFIDETVTRFDDSDIPLPDILGVGVKGEITCMAEVKFEGLGKAALGVALKQYDLAVALGITYILVVPASPLHSRKISDSWLRNSLPSGINVFRFRAREDTPLPKAEDLEFLPLGRQEEL